MELEDAQDFTQIETQHEKVASKKVEFPYGHPKNPIDQDALIAKFKDCVKYSVKQISGKNVNKLIQLILNLENMKGIGETTEYI
jgi:2-methylcitrate dehydratase PrpD